MFNGINMLTPDDKENAQNNITKTEKIMEANPILKAQAMIAAEQWVQGNKSAQAIKEKNPKLYKAYFNAVVVERAAMLTGII